MIKSRTVLMEVIRPFHTAIPLNYSKLTRMTFPVNTQTQATAFRLFTGKIQINSAISIIGNDL